jgi:hypothetical protein
MNEESLKRNSGGMEQETWYNSSQPWDLRGHGEKRPRRRNFHTASDLRQEVGTIPPESLLSVADYVD